MTTFDEKQFDAQKDILDVIGVLSSSVDFDSALNIEVAFIRIARLAEAGKVLFRQSEEIARLKQANDLMTGEKNDDNV